MKRMLLLCVVILFAWAGVLCAQDEPTEQEMEGITHGEFAVLLLKAAAGYTDTLSVEADDLDLVKRYGLIPASWEVDAILTQAAVAADAPLARLDTDELHLSLRSAEQDVLSARAALDQLLRRHYDRIHAVCRRIAGPTRDSDDACQEALIKIANAIAMTAPDAVFVNSGSDADVQTVREMSLAKGEESTLAMPGRDRTTRRSPLRRQTRS